MLNNQNMEEKAEELANGADNEPVLSRVMPVPIGKARWR